MKILITRYEETYVYAPVIEAADGVFIVPFDCKDDLDREGIIYEIVKINITL